MPAFHNAGTKNEAHIKDEYGLDMITVSEKGVRVSGLPSAAPYIRSEYAIAGLKDTAAIKACCSNPPTNSFPLADLRTDAFLVAKGGFKQRPRR